MMMKTKMMSMLLVLLAVPLASASHACPDGTATLRVTWMVDSNAGIEIVRTYQVDIYDLGNGCQVEAEFTSTDLTVSAAESGDVSAEGNFEGHYFEGTGLCYSVTDELTDETYWYIEFRGSLEGSSAYSFHAETISQSAVEQFL